MAQGRSHLWVLVAIAEAVLLVACFRELQLLPDGKAHAYVLDVGQGDSILLVSPSGKQILIDGGPNQSLLRELPKHLPFFDRTIELLVLTHPDLDHLAALPEVLRRYKVKRVLMAGAEKDASRYEEFLSLLPDEKAEILIPEYTKDIDFLDGLVLDIVWPQESLVGKTLKEHNDYGIVMRALHGGRSLLLAADIEHDAEEAILASGVMIDSDILKVPHHGSKTSSTQPFLAAVSPQLALISSGRNSQYGHPHAEVVERYKAMGIPIRVTAWEGTIGVEF